MKRRGPILHDPIEDTLWIPGTSFVVSIREAVEGLFKVNHGSQRARLPASNRAAPHDTR